MVFQSKRFNSSFRALTQIRAEQLRHLVDAIAEEYLINANVYKFFDLLVCGDEVEKGKPHPEIFITAAQIKFTT